MPGIDVNGFGKSEHNANRASPVVVLLGFIRQETTLPARALKEIEIDHPKLQAAVEDLVGRGEGVVGGEIGLTPRGNRVVELAVSEAFRLNQQQIDAEHLMVAILREGNGNAVSALKTMSVDVSSLFDSVLRNATPHPERESQSDELLERKPGQATKVDHSSDPEVDLPQTMSE